MMRICPETIDILRIRILHIFFYPDKCAVSQIISDLAFHLARQGHDVEAIASQAVYEGGKRLPANETVNGVRIRRVWAPSLGKSSTIGRLADFACYVFGSLSAAMFSPRADRLVILTNPPMYPLVGLLLNFFRREPYVYVLMDLFPEAIIRTGAMKPKGLLARLLTRLTKATFLRAKKVITLGTCMASLVEDYGVPPAKIEIVRNWANDELVRPIAPQDNPLRQELGLGGKFIVMYSGNMGHAQRFEDILQAAENLRERDDIHFLFIGGGVRRSEIETFRDEHGLDSITVLNYFPREQLAYSLPLGDAHLVCVREGFEGIQVPSKSYGIMAAGRPIIYQGNSNGEVARMIREEGGGVVVAEGDADGLTEIIRRWADNPADAHQAGSQARKILEQRYTERIGLRKYQEILES